MQLANAGGAPARITLIAGTSGYIGPAGSTMGLTKPEVDLYFDTSGGRTKIGTFDTGHRWTANTAYAGVYQTGASRVLRVVDPDQTDRFGLFREYSKVASLAAAARTPGSWYSDGKTLYLDPFDGVAPGDATARPYLDVALWTWTPHDATVPHNLFIDGIDFEGGKDSNLFVSVGAAVARYPAEGYVLAIRNCTFRYGGGGATGSGGVYVDGWPGLVYASGSDASASWSDNWNWHFNTTQTASAMYVLTVDDTGSDAGRGGLGVVSNNGWTAHDDHLVGIDVAGDYRGARGRTFHIIGNSRTLAAGTVAAGSLGDLANGGSFGPAEFAAGDTARLWLDSAYTRPNARTGQALVASEGSRIRVRGGSAIRGMIATTGSGQIGSY